MFRRAVALLLLLAFFASPLTISRASAQDEARGRPPAEKRLGRKKANVPFLFSAFAITWIAIWIHLVVVHRGQRRLEKTLERMEGEGKASS